ncbi:MAG: hypothetical protein EBS84_04335 [Proteobacteria bacterium]|nr:hypothetical protein [Verrucomicrobiota bacterium]NBU08232.1 hypothetical protein [Pseudomonadota bacterium]
MKRICHFAFGLLLAATFLPAVEPNQSGPLKMLTASWLGGAGEEQIVAAEIGQDLSVVLAVNAVELNLSSKPVVLGQATPKPAATVDSKKPNKGGKPSADPNTAGFIVRLSLDGQKQLSAARFAPGTAKLLKLKADSSGNLLVLGDAAGIMKLAGAEGTGRFVATLSADAGRALACVFVAGALDFAVDGNRDLVVLTKGHLIRFGPDGKQKWDVTWSSHGDNRPGGMAVSLQTGIAVVTGYGMTHTGKEPYKDPYAYAFDREGKPLWSLWNPDPKLLVDKKYGGNGLMADTTGHFAGADAAGKIYFSLFADGGNSVCTRDPKRVNEKIDASVFDGVFQKSPGFGFKGASKTAVLFRVNPADGRLEKGTWMSAWLTPQRANGLGMEGVAGDGLGRTFIVGNSASGCPTKNPWFAGVEGGYQGGGFLAVLDAGFKMQQCGYFQGTSIECVAFRNGHLVIGGSAVKESVSQDKTKPELKPVIVPVPLFKPLQGTFGGGNKDAWFAVFKLD